MRFEISVAPGSRVLPIPELPDIPVARVEGRNGIGKSLAVRLLQLVVGEQPYLGMPAAWESLRRGLGPFEVVVTGLRGADELRFAGDPSLWPDEVEPVAEWVGEHSIDGQKAGLSSVKELLAIHRIAGDESLLATIASRISHDAALTARLGTRARDRADEVDSLLALAAVELERAAPGRYAEVVAAHVRVGRELDQATRDTDQQRKMVSRLAAARQTLTDIDAITTEAPALDAAIEAHDRLIKELRKRVDELDTKRSSFQASLYHVDELRKQSKKAATAAKSAATKLGNLRVSVERLASELGLATTAEAIEAEAASVRAALKQAVSERGEIDATPRVVRVVTALSADLRKGLESGIADRPVAELQDGQFITATELRDAVRRMRKRLIGQPPPDEAKRLDEVIVALRDRRDAIDTLAQQLTAMERAQETLERHETTLAELQEQLDARDAERLVSLTEDLEAARKQQIQAEVDRADAIRRRAMLAGGRALPELRRELKRLLEPKDMPSPKDIPAAEIDAMSRLAAAEQELEAAHASVEEIAEERGRIEEELTALTRRLRTDAQYQWIRDRWARHLSEADLTTSAAALLELEKAVDSARNSVSGAAATMQSLAPPLDMLATAVSTGKRPSAKVREIDQWMQTLRPWYETSFGEHFREPAIQAALFDNGEFVGLDLVQPSVTWRADDGQQQTRPLEAFSSGEKVFAYTLARLVSLRDAKAVNTVIALDEFGAFVAGDRFSRLERYLHRRVLGTIADQIYIILPLRVDYEAIPAPSDEEQRYASAIRERGYFVEGVEVAE